MQCGHGSSSGVSFFLLAEAEGDGGARPRAEAPRFLVTPPGSGAPTPAGDLKWPLPHERRCTSSRSLRNVRPQLGQACSASEVKVELAASLYCAHSFELNGAPHGTATGGAGAALPFSRWKRSAQVFWWMASDEVPNWRPHMWQKGSGGGRPPPMVDMMIARLGEKRPRQREKFLKSCWHDKPFTCWESISTTGY